MLKKSIMALVLIIILYILLNTIRYKEAILIELNIEEISKTELSETNNDIIVKYLIEKGYENYIKDDLEYFSFNSEELVDSDFELIYVELKSEFSYGIIILKNKEVKKISINSLNDKLYLTDLNSDNSMELLVQSSVGSGILRVLFSLYDLSDFNVYAYGYYDDSMDGKLVSENGNIVVYSQYREFQGQKFVGPLKYTSDGISIEGYSNELNIKESQTENKENNILTQESSKDQIKTVESIVEDQEEKINDDWIQQPSYDPIETVESAIRNQIEKEYTLNINIESVEVDDAETNRISRRYIGSDLAEKRGWSDEDLIERFVVVYANYYVEYDHTKTFLDDGNMKQYFYLLQDEKDSKWTIVGNTGAWSE